MELSKKIAVQYTAKTLTGVDISGMCLREEFFDLIIDHEFYAKIAMTPDNLDEFVTGLLLGKGIIRRPEDILVSRLCDANKFYIQLAPELAAEVKTAEGIVNFAPQFAVPAWGDIIALRSERQYTTSEIVETAQKFDTDIRYYAADPHNNDIILDSNPLSAVDKLNGQNKHREMLITNALPTTEQMIRAYRGRIPIGIYSGIPTGGAIAFAKKAGITLISKTTSGEYAIYADSSRRLVD